MNETRIYYAQVDDLFDKDLFLKAYNSVSEYRQKKIDLLTCEKDKILSLGAGLLLKKALEDCDIVEKNLVYAQNAFGKPYLPEYQNLNFNLSHSENFVMCAVSGSAVGCDVEKIDDKDFRLAKRFFHENEYKKIFENKNYAVQQELFFDYWTLKESFIKTIGKGLHQNLNSFFINLESKKDEQFLMNFENKIYYLRLFDFCNGYKFACCSDNDLKKCDIVCVKDFHYI